MPHARYERWVYGSLKHSTAASTTSPSVAWAAVSSCMLGRFCKVLQVVQRQPNHLFSHLLLAKIYIGQGLPALALQALDEAARIQPEHWQTHLLRLFVLKRLDRLYANEATQSHRIVCARIREACAQADMPSAAALMCVNELVQFEPTGMEIGRSDKADGLRGVEAGTNAIHLGAHLVTDKARKKLRIQRYVTLRRLLPRRLIRLLQAWYASLRLRMAETAAFQAKTQRHEYFPEVLSTYLNLALEPLASSISQTMVAPTYPFPITYIPGGGIHPHLDVSDNELSLTFQVQLEGSISQWPLVFLDPRGQELSNLNASTAKHVVLKDNDGVLYYGPDIVHWRENQHSTLTQIVFAFREEDVTHCNNQ
uniref:Uncharacterized protein n=1 Tax=Calcidiscus leptoporus TaxID=127549 RepID=A0A7S0JK33_9EUKA|mmetsp:Transcript_8410/g.19718  ORF Transcript_8410/g.19718 Transcript_8410/m.19718 type:complete len:366 (+) Transcript_8410:798-1895(+)